MVGEVVTGQAWEEHTSLLPTMHWLRLSLTIPSCKGSWEMSSVCVPRKKRKGSGECTVVWPTGLSNNIHRVTERLQALPRVAVCELGRRGRGLVLRSDPEFPSSCVLGQAMPRPKLRLRNRPLWPPTRNPTSPAVWPGSWPQTSTSQVGPAEEGAGGTECGEVPGGGHFFFFAGKRTCPSGFTITCEF